EALEEMKKNTKIRLKDVEDCSENIKSKFLEPDKQEGFVREIMNEFACVIDAEYIRFGTEKGDKYLSSRRETWQMDLPNKQDRILLLQIYEKYCKNLEKEAVLSVDQMIADLNRYLLSHEWRQLRMTHGYDLIFVDELHFFNRAERMVFHNLFRKDIDRRLPLMMAYDLKQGTDDRFLGLTTTEQGSSFFGAIGLGASELVELTRNFRSTPQISAFLSDLDGAFPALDLAGEWTKYSAASSRKHGDTPILYIFKTNKELIDEIFKQAGKEAKKRGGKNVAIICVSEEMFVAYLDAGRIKGQYVSVSSRDEVSAIRNCGKRCVFSMPEYVSGLQFEIVYLIHADKREIMQDPDNIGLRRRFVSRCYLGASRASDFLTLAVSLERGGEADALARPIKVGSLLVAGEVIRNNN
ncbi:MAG: hypothetical protein GVY13_14715, partial [Alphaproteobacteria bacterium]|nr:hypothetical protein [Alphaproteobacteria bacterium]